MAINPQVSTRVMPDVVARLDRCVEASNLCNPGHPIDRGGLVRVLILQGLPAMEKTLGLGTPPMASPSGPGKKTRRRS